MSMREENRRLREQLEAVRYALCEIHEYTCGCETPGDLATCAASPAVEFKVITKADIEWAYAKGRADRAASSPASKSLVEMSEDEKRIRAELEAAPSSGEGRDPLRAPPWQADQDCSAPLPLRRGLRQSRGVNPWILITVSATVLYGLWLLLHFTFTMIDRAHEHLRRAEPRNAGVPLRSEKDG